MWLHFISRQRRKTGSQANMESISRHIRSFGKSSFSVSARRSNAFSSQSCFLYPGVAFCMGTPHSETTMPLPRMSLASRMEWKCWVFPFDSLRCRHAWQCRLLYFLISTPSTATSHSLPKR